ncbi:hypothetical protein KC19_5G158400 [Ceratodon purpureus]|uniref:Uncharacterized protein n=1 Tax=Ceratodon purpureus TaxID=3225 RepID=A0A8T0I371_CERPU|nr:hypothetical protein KC19_5G158400 [Ceratodon purpureus]
MFSIGGWHFISRFNANTPSLPGGDLPLISIMTVFFALSRALLVWCACEAVSAFRSSSSLGSSSEELPLGGDGLGGSGVAPGFFSCGGDESSESSELWTLW